MDDTVESSMHGTAEWSAADVLRELVASSPSDHSVSAGPIWVHVRPRSGAELPEHGWKLHVAARERTLPALTDRLLPRLLSEGCRFKIARTGTVLRRLNGGRQNPAVVGKAVTVYPDADRVVSLGRELAELLAGYDGPRILSDRRVRADAPVYYRYGPFRARWHADANGLLFVRLHGPAGAAFDAAATLEYRQPDWVADPFGAPAVGTTGEVLLGGRYRVVVGVFGAAHGNVYRAVDTLDHAHPDRTVIVKQARAYVGESASGIDARSRLRNERRVLTGCGDLAGVPRFLDHFAHDGDEYLVTTDVGTQNLLALVRGTGGLLPGRPGAGDGEFVELGARLAAILTGLHERGIVMRDLSPRNIVLDGADPRIIDFGISSWNGFHLPGGTPGFAPPEQLSPANLLEPAPEHDAYALGMVLGYAATGLLPVTGVGTAERGRDRATRSLAAIYGDRRAGFRTVVGGLLSGERSAVADALTALLERRWIDPAARPSTPEAPAVHSPVPEAPGVRSAVPEAPASPAVRPAVPEAPAPPAAIDPDPAAGLTRAVLDVLLTEVADYQLGGESGDFAAVDASLYTGSAGVGLELVHHRDQPVVPALLGRLVEHARTALRRVSLPAGLFSGVTGPALFLAAMGEAAPAISTAPDVDDEYDVAGGAAGTGLGLLALGDLDGAGACARRLLRRADLCEPTTPRDASIALDPGFGYVHGFVGATDFLTVYAGRTGEAETLAAAHRRLRLIAQRVPELAARANATGPMTASWCRGLAGVARTLAHGWQVYDDTDFAAAAERAALASAAWVPRLDNLGQCCGATGIGTMLVELARIFDSDRYLVQARAVVAHLQRRNHGPEERPVLIHAAVQETPYAWAQGYAGLLTFLRRVQHPESPDPFLPSIR